jgi:hypothetical protein
MTALDVLQGARALVMRGWTKFAKARDKIGYPVAYDSPNAVCHCAEGALLCAAGRETTAYLGAVKVMSGVVAGGILPPFNDLPETTQADVVAAFDRAIEMVSR